MEDSAGNRYLDMYNNVPGVGSSTHYQAMVRRAGLLNTNTRYLFPVLEQYADNLLATFPAGLSNVIFTCTGSERHRPADGPLYQWSAGDHRHRGAYHGNTTAVMEVSPGTKALLPPWVHTIPPLTCAGCQRARRCLTSSPPTLSAPWTSWMSGATAARRYWWIPFFSDGVSPIRRDFWLRR